MKRPERLNFSEMQGEGLHVAECPLDGEPLHIGLIAGEWLQFCPRCHLGRRTQEPMLFGSTVRLAWKPAQS